MRRDCLAICASCSHLAASLTDENIRKNWEMYGHPDGRQEVSMGIALPKWIVESGNNIWVLGAYGVIFGGALPAIVVRDLVNTLLLPWNLTSSS